MPRTFEKYNMAQLACPDGRTRELEHAKRWHEFSPQPTPTTNHTQNTHS